MAEPLRLAIAGLGTVGKGVLRLLETNADLLTSRAGRPLKVTAVSARDRTKDRGVDLTGVAWEDDMTALAAREDVDVVVELVGGSDGPALALAKVALERGKGFVTANKAMIAHHGLELSELAEAKSTPLMFEAAVAGGVPVVKGLREGAAANAIERIYGILNGTCNYILSTMEDTGRSFADVLAEAQVKGFAEADPTFDVEGVDAAHKLAILACIAFGAQQRPFLCGRGAAGDPGAAVVVVVTVRQQAKPRRRADLQQGQGLGQGGQHREQHRTTSGLVGLGMPGQHGTADRVRLSLHKRWQFSRPGHTASGQANGGQKQIGLLTVRRQIGEKGQKILGLRDAPCQGFIGRGMAVRFLVCEAAIARGDVPVGRGHGVALGLGCRFLLGFLLGHIQ